MPGDTAAHPESGFSGEDIMKVSLYLTLAQIVGQEPEKAGERLKAVVQAAEQAGFDACNLTDHPAPSTEWINAGGHDAFDPFASLSFMAAATSRIRLHTNIIVLPYRNPFITAKAAATLDVLSGGRLILGIGSGYQQVEYEALGADFAGRGAAMDEAIDVMKLAWSGESVVYRGKTFAAQGVLPRPLPLQKPHPPIWAGGNSNRALRRAAEKCDGWAPFFVSPKQAARNLTDALVTREDLVARIAIVRGYRDAAGRTGPFDICANAATGFRARTPGDAHAMIEETGKLAEAGVTWINCDIPGVDVAAVIDGIAWCADAVLPHIR